MYLMVMYAMESFLLSILSREMLSKDDKLCESLVRKAFVLTCMAQSEKLSSNPSILAL